MPSPTSAAPLNAWFTLHGDFIGVSGIPVRLAPGQQIDSNAWYTADGHRAAVAGPFRDEAMNRQGYLRGGQILAANKMQQAALKAGVGPRHATAVAAPAAASEGGLQLLDWVSVTGGGAGTAFSLKEMELVKRGEDLVKEGADGIKRWHSPKTGRWYPVANQPNGFTGPRGAILEESGAIMREAGRFNYAGHVCLVAGELISVYQGFRAYYSNDKDREKKMNKAGLDFAMGLVSLLGPAGFVISTIYFVVDATISLKSNGANNILDLFGPQGGNGPMTRQTSQELLLVAPIDKIRVTLPRRVATRTLANILNQMPMASHNAVFRPSSK